jgi:hypothetical protein
VLGDPRRECSPGITVVVEMELDLSEACAGELRESIEEVGAIFLARKEPAMARRSAVAVAKLSECGVALGPGIDASLADVLGGTAPQWLVVVAQREQDVSRLRGAWRSRTANEVPAVVANPVLEVLLAQAT